MDLFAQMDDYCERTDLAFWSEPVNAITNMAFVLAAYIMWRRMRGAGLPIGNILAANLALIGVGSFLFHTFATAWAELADVIPIASFILIYLFVAFRDYINLPSWASAIGAVLFIPYAFVLTPLFRKLPFFDVSAFYWPIPVLLIAVAIYIWRQSKATAQGLLIGTALLSVSLTFRSLDHGICHDLPLGTHFMWHILNGVMLGWMIEVYRRHMLAKLGAGR